MNFKEAVDLNRRAVLSLSEPELELVLPTLYEIREETARQVYRFLKKTDLASPYDMQKHRALLGQLDDAIKTAEKDLPDSMLKELRTEGKSTMKVSMKNLQVMITAGEKQFSQSTTPLRLNVVKILNKQDRKMMIERFPNSAAKYGADVAAAIKHDFAVSLIRGESIEQMARRLSDGKYDAVAKRGKAAVAETIADGQFYMSRSDAERLARTEQNSLYNDTQIEGIKQADADDPGWKKRWDAANDERVCDDCDDLDDTIVDADEDFKGGISGPPLHPNDRCSVIPYREGWPKTL